MKSITEIQNEIAEIRARRAARAAAAPIVSAPTLGDEIAAALFADGDTAPAPMPEDAPDEITGEEIPAAELLAPVDVRDVRDVADVRNVDDDTAREYVPRQRGLAEFGEFESLVDMA